MEPDLADVREHVRLEYAGVFDENMLHRYLADYVQLGEAPDLVERLRLERPDARAVLDVGCGYGSFVLAAREAGFDAVGVDLAEYELDFARRRLARSRPDEDPNAVYRLGDAVRLPYGDSSFDVVTAWNVFEHVPDLLALLREIRRVLRPGGSLLAIAPNYASLRREAHYHVFLPPLISRDAAAAYLRWRGRNPDFFKNHVFYRTNRSVTAALRAAGFDADTPQHQIAKLRRPLDIRRSSVRRALTAAERLGLTRALAAGLKASYRNPLRRRIDVHARRAESS